MKKLIIISSIILGLFTVLLFTNGCNALYKQQTSAGPFGTTITNEIVNPLITNAENTANTVAGFLPQPFASYATAILSIIGGGLAIGLKKMQGKFNTASDVLNAVSAGVTAVGHDETIASIQNHAVVAGVHDALPISLQAANPNSKGG